jgi:RecJ-like exonuclease
MNDPRNEKELPLKKCSNCDGTGFSSTICVHCGYDLRNDINDFDTFSNNDPCSNCGLYDCLPECDQCEGKGERQMTEEEYNAYIEHLKYGHEEKY